MTKYKMTKSDRARKLFKQGFSVVEVTKRVGMNYGHAYNVMQRMMPKTEETEVEYVDVIPEDNTVEQVLVERGNDYGDYASKAQFIQGVKYLMRTSPSWEAMDADMRESMEMIAHKMGRVVYGDPTHKDNFLDIAGYAKLVADRL
jgi:hypothetical protein